MKKYFSLILYDTIDFKNNFGKTKKTNEVSD
jgi:hypothetical protein